MSSGKLEYIAKESSGDCGRGVMGSKAYRVVML